MTFRKKKSKILMKQDKVSKELSLVLQQNQQIIFVPDT